MDQMDFPKNGDIEQSENLAASPLPSDAPQPPIEHSILEDSQPPIWDLFQGSVPAQSGDDAAEETLPAFLDAVPSPEETASPSAQAEALVEPQAFDGATEDFSNEDFLASQDAAAELPSDLPEAASPEEPPSNYSADDPLHGASFMNRIPEVDAPDGDILEVSPDNDPLLDFEFLREHKAHQEPESQSAAEESETQEYNDEGIKAPEKKPGRSRQRVARKGRPKRKKGQGLWGIPQILSTAVWLALIVAIGVTAGRMLWVCAADVLAFGREDKIVTVTIYETDTMEQIIDKLYDAGLFQYKGLFSLYASISHAEEDIQPGIYDLNTLYDYHALVNMMSPRSSREVVKLTIPEGYSCRQIFSLLEDNRICTAVDIGAYAARGELNDYWFLDGVARGDHYCLEGFLFPDTYQFYKNSTPKEALERMLDNFEIRFSEEMRGQIANLNAALGSNYGVREVTIVASLIEKESANPEESPKIAGVIYNRLFRWNGTPAYLNIDASIIYALNGRTDLTQEDLRTDSPYNTYTRTGLTPTPISNPGLASLKAALNPENHNYYYYVLNPATGRHQFSTTYEEHMGYVNQFAEAR